MTTAHETTPLPVSHSERNLRVAFAATLVFLGGYLVIASLTGQLTVTLTGLGPQNPALGVLLVLQFIFALLVVVAGLLVAPGAAAPKAIASAIVVVGIVIALALFAARISGALRLPRELNFVMNPYVFAVLIIGIAWLIVRRAGLGWLSLIGVVLLAVVAVAMVFAGIDGIVTQLVMLALSAVVGAGIIAAGRPWRD